MKNRSWPDSVTFGTREFSFSGIYREGGLDFDVRVDETNIPEDSSLSTAELHTLLANRQNAVTNSNVWRLWLLVGSRQNNTFGLMFDSQPPHRQGAVAFFDAVLGDDDFIASSAQNQKLGDVHLAFLRTIVHEAGHAFNLYHPKHDVHDVTVGTTIMNQTGDVMSFATPSNPYPDNSTLAFNEHNRRSLVHSPDPQVKPGWKRFGWGHGSASSGIPEPTDVFGLDNGIEVKHGFELKANFLETVVHPGEFIAGTIELKNVSDQRQTVPNSLNPVSYTHLTLPTILLV